MATERLSSIIRHLAPGSSLNNIQSKNPDDIVITLAVRTPLTKAKKGGFKDTTLEYMIYALLEQVRLKSGIDPALVEDFCLGNVSDSKAAYKLRAAALAAGSPNTAGASSVNRFCSSGLKATADIAHAITNGSIEVGVALGAESMSIGGDSLDKPFDEAVTSKSQEAADCMMPMGWTSENVSKDFSVTDGAAAVLLMKRSTAVKLGQPIVAKYVASTVAGLAPRIMGIGPSIAIPKLLAQVGITLADCDVIELNEAFASMAVYCRDTLALDWTKMNPRGGAIALGHPLGATGARQIVTGLSELRRTNKKILLTSMCIGSGQGMAGLFVNEQ